MNGGRLVKLDRKEVWLVKLVVF